MDWAPRSQQALGLALTALILLTMFASPVGAYDLLALRQDWGPNTCATVPCIRSPYGVFSIYGLTPTNINSDDPSQAPGGCPGPDFDVAQMPAAVQEEMKCIFADYENAGNDQKLWKDLWDSEGKCSGMNVEQYFTFITTAFNSYSANAALADANIAAGTVDRDVLLDAIQTAYGAKAWLICNVATKAVTYVTVCFDRTSVSTPVPIDCPWDRNSASDGGGAECAGPLTLAEGFAPPSECTPYFPKTLSGAFPYTPAPASPSPEPFSPSYSPNTPVPQGSGEAPGTPSPPPSSSGKASGTSSPPPLSPSPPQGSSSSDSGSSSSMGVIIGAAVGGVVAVATVVAGFFMWRKRSAQRSAAAAVDASETTKPGTAPPTTLPPGSPLDSFIDVRDGDGGGGGIGASQVLAGAAGAGGVYYAPSRSTSSTSPQAQLSLASQSQGAATPQTRSLLPADYTTLGSVPTNGGLVAGAAAASLPASQQHDPLMSYVQTQLHSLPESHTSGGSVGTPSSSRALSGGSAAFWAIPFAELKILRPIGEGSFGRVYAAEWHSTPVAVKLLIGDSQQAPQGSATGSGSLQVAMSSPLLAKMEGEAELMLALRHPNCCSIMGVCEHPPCLVTEFCERGSVTECLRAARSEPAAEAELTWPRRLAMALDAAKGMIYLHTRTPAIIHRDLKSPNLLVDSSWRVKVCDFNLSKYLSDSTNTSSVAAMNPRWLAPEVMQGERATQASDVFAFGVVLWELLTWELPWATANPWQLVGLVVHGGRLPIPAPEDLPGPDRLPPQLLAGYLGLVQACWAQSPADRPGFHWIIEQLRSLLDQLSSSDGGGSGEPLAVVT